MARLTHLPNRLRFMLSAALLGLLPVQPSSALDLPLHEVTLPPGFSINARMYVVEVKLLFRRAYKGLADSKGWRDDDIVMASRRLLVSSR